MRTGARASLTLSRSPCKHSGWTPETQMHHRKWKYRVLRILELTLYFSFFISLCFGLPEAYGVPRPGSDQATVVTYATAATVPDL